MEEHKPSKLKIGVRVPVPVRICSLAVKHRSYEPGIVGAIPTRCTLLLLCVSYNGEYIRYVTEGSGSIPLTKVSKMGDFKLATI